MTCLDKGQLKELQLEAVVLTFPLGSWLLKTALFSVITFTVKHIALLFFPLKQTSHGSKAQNANS